MPAGSDGVTSRTSCGGRLSRKVLRRDAAFHNKQAVAINGEANYAVTWIKSNCKWLGFTALYRIEEILALSIRRQHVLAISSGDQPKDTFRCNGLGFAV